MISKEESAKIAEKHIENVARSVPEGLALLEEYTIEKDYGWVYFYSTKKYKETRDPLDGLGGNGPFIVERSTGDIYTLSSALPEEVSIREFEIAHGY